MLKTIWPEVEQKPTRGARINWAHPLARGLVRCLPLNENAGGAVFDAAKRTTYAVSSPAGWTAGLLGSQLHFDGTATWIDLGDLGLTSGTVEVRARFTDVSTDHRLYSQVSGSTTQGGAIGISSGVGAGAVTLWNGNTWSTLAATGTLSVGQLYHLLFVYQSGQCTLWLNGKQQSTVSTTFDFSGVHFGLGEKFVGSFGGTLAGDILKVSIYNRALPAAEIAALADPATAYAMFEPPIVQRWAVSFAGGTAHGQTISTTAGSTAALAKAVGAIRAATGNSTAQGSRQAAIARAAPVGSTAAAIKQAHVIRPVVASTALTLSKAVTAVRVATGGNSSSLGKAIAHALSAMAGNGTTLGKGMSKVLLTTVSSATTISSLKVHLQVIAATAGSIARWGPTAVGKAMGGTAAAASGLGRGVSATRGATAAASAGIAKGLTHTIAATATTAAAIVKGIGHAIASIAAALASLTTTVRRFVANQPGGATLTLTEPWTATLTLTEPWTATLTLTELA